MPPETQGKIVRALQEQTFERIGGSSRVEVDVRVVASTNRDLAGEISAGRFREDLFYRLNVVPIRVPPLRERREDIPLMARHFMMRSSDAARLVPREFGEDAMATLQAYSWPGNVRQLRNVIDWLLIMAPGESREPIRADMLPNEITVDRADRREMGKGKRNNDAAVARRARSLRARIPFGAGYALWREYIAHGSLRRHGALRPASQTQISQRFRHRPTAENRGVSAMSVSRKRRAREAGAFHACSASGSE